MNDGEVAHEANVDIVSFEVRNRDRPGGVFEEATPIEERPVGKRTQEIVRQNLSEPIDVRVLDRADVVPIELNQSGVIGRHHHL